MGPSVASLASGDAQNAMGAPKILAPNQKPESPDWERWEPNRFNTSAASPTNRVAATRQDPAAERRDAGAAQESAKEEGYRAGFESGHQEGLAAGRLAAEEEARVLAAQLAGAITRFDQGVSRLEQDVAEQLLNLALSIARRVVGETLEAKPEVVLATIREALAHLPAQHSMIRLNSQDAELIRAQTGDSLGRAGHRILEDPQLARGDVLVEAGGTQVDARLATRWQRVWDSLEPDPAASRNTP